MPYDVCTVVSHRRSLRRLQSGGVDPVVEMGCRIGSSSLAEQFLLLSTRRETRSAFTREFGKHCQAIPEGLNLFETPPLLLGALTNDTGEGRSSKSYRVSYAIRRLLQDVLSHLIFDGVRF